MPRTRKSRSRRRSRRKSGRRMMTRARANRRFQQVDIRHFWFKFNSEIVAVAKLNTRFQPEPALYDIESLRRLFYIYDEYKVLGYTVKLFPSNIGTESSNIPGSGVAFERGNHVVWSDQNWPSGTVSTPVNIAEIINTASARMINPRKPYSRSIWRPSGHATWTSTEQDSNGNPLEIDDWSPCINLFYQDASNTTTPGPPMCLWFYTVQYKVAMRGRKQDP